MFPAPGPPTLPPPPPPDPPALPAREYYGDPAPPSADVIVLKIELFPLVLVAPPLPTVTG